MSCLLLCWKYDELMKEKSEAIKKCEELQHQLSALESSQSSNSEVTRSFQVRDVWIMVVIMSIIVIDMSGLVSVVVWISHWCCQEKTMKVWIQLKKSYADLLVKRFGEYFNIFLDYKVNDLLKMWKIL